MKIVRALASWLVLSLAAFAADAPKIAPVAAAKLVAEGKAVLVDCREPNEWKSTGVAAPAVLLPKSDFDGDQKQWKEFLAQNRDKQIIVYCASGGRSGRVADSLAAQGLKAANAGGLKDWTNAGLPTRQVDAAKTDAKAPVKK